MIAGGATYFAMMRPQRDATDEEHAAWAREYAEGVLGTYRQAPAWSWACWSRAAIPEGFPGGYEDDLISLAFAFENLMLAARAEGLGSVPDHRVPALREGRACASSSASPTEVDPAIVSPIGYPEAFPTGLAPALKRNFRPWKALVHDDTWGQTRD